MQALSRGASVGKRLDSCMKFIERTQEITTRPPTQGHQDIPVTDPIAEIRHEVASAKRVT